MGSYADSLLTEARRSSDASDQHWLSLFLECRLSIVLWGIGVVAARHRRVAQRRRRRDRAAASASARIGDHRARARSSSRSAGGTGRPDEYVITNRRLLKVDGHHQQALGGLEPREDQRRDPGGEPPGPDAGLRRPGHPDRGGGRPSTTTGCSTTPRPSRRQMMTAKHALEYGHRATATSPLARSRPRPPSRHRRRPRPSPHRPTRAPTERADTPGGGRPVAGPPRRRCATRAPSPTERVRSQEAGAAGPAVGRSHHGASRTRLVYALIAVGIMLARGLPGPRVLPRLRGVSSWATPPRAGRAA